jgi:ribosome silencing factor RsfS/YbeB/iojap
MNTPTSTRRHARTPALIKLEKQALAALTDMKAVNIKVIDVRGLTDVADTMIIASGNSDRHVRAIADNVIAEVKGAGRRPLGVEGARDGEWVLVDLTDVLVHVMLPRVREFYALEQLWEPPVVTRSAAAKPGKSVKPVRKVARKSAPAGASRRRVPAKGKASGKRGPRR